ncbi:MAG: Ribosomal RNA small subunit methyltransferase A [Candidatus Jorgensenbacteria bacterium GW2011_GWA1_48_11]|uniref:Ribosomal RNA small subunit methyltransferase A n=1 Tax=Candidatus Jorgensenbacteria bacterium GW2011_GWA1_48_11 TaxID=1618660 RepID=A0A0G1UBT1_9BACT|nr:MAG: Ribosomal RNA small subunit methyltransferase A [Candidatus Jorgensenbacteria bacterium GW2011_GWA1_48_11]KKW12077.1 MAG: Ribosomal RNA small subunit methyltransferase A [Candidatus Jorgensenbacteria bacterium GW2011_GWB1_49_9]
MGEKLGQHFLKNSRKIKGIAAALDLEANDIVIEIGPGHGELTRELRIKNGGIRIIAIEKDKKLAEGLREKFFGDEKLEIIEDDALKALPSIIHDSKFIIQNYKLVGNIPYYITGHLLRVIGELRKKPELAVLTVQREVALRLCARPPRMNLLSAAVRFWAEPKIVDFIPKKDFSPQPRVDSAIVRLETRPTEGKTEENYYRLTRAVFQQPRKTVFNNLKAARLTTEVKLLTLLRKNNISSLARPQDLSLETLKKLALMLYNEY